MKIGSKWILVLTSGDIIPCNSKKEAKDILHDYKILGGNCISGWIFKNSKHFVL